MATGAFDFEENTKEVVQEVCSSSESDSEDDDLDRVGRKTKKQTLSPGHAREVDRKAEAFVMSIIEADPARPVADSLVCWADDVVDVRVDNLVRLISNKHNIRKDMIRGGVSQVDVESMRERIKGGKRKTEKEKHRGPPIHFSEEAQIQTVVKSILTPEIQRLDENVAAAVASVKDATSNALDYRKSVVATVEGMLRNFKTEIL
ncbi:hypothetical protein HA466_0224990 [Hirschfeldia incana]|nr:hypothetical protein HA466_0224990 [Hirschfeldia incana]